MTIGFRPRRGRNATLNLIFFEKRVVRVIKINFFLFELGHPNMIKPHIDVDVKHDELHYAHIRSLYEP